MTELAVLAVLGTALGIALGLIAATVWLQRPCKRCALLDAGLVDFPPQCARCALLDAPPVHLPPPVSFIDADHDKTPVHRRRGLPAKAYRDPHHRTTIDLRAPKLDDEEN